MKNGKRGHQQLYWGHPKNCGQGSCFCRVCSNQCGLMQKYGLHMSCQYFHQYVADTGFIKLD
ncbi:40S ribosomal protein S29-like [Ailuropoda melanoleuca]|uniref:40S ribosomal protein S29-like n=1 Tax=Ailuropoda melanoleuca TaxID=9646 RepID=UPI00149430FF|nr:40S ribosomal protein S29-like [Ailuropoda melanoleuca]